MCTIVSIPLVKELTNLTRTVSIQHVVHPGFVCVHVNIQIVTLSLLFSRCSIKFGLADDQVKHLEVRD